MEKASKAMMCDGRGNPLPLISMSVNGTIDDIVSCVSIEQTYKNAEKKPIEAIYTFPLPINAVLLGMEVELEGKKLVGKVIEKKQAENRYEDAIAEGNAAVMLEQSQDGLYTVNVGNLLPGATAKIVFRYAELDVWNGDTLRFFLPTVIAERYGSPLDAGMAPHAVPETLPGVQRTYGLSLRLVGNLAKAKVHCPTHTISSSVGEDGSLCVLLDDAFVNRDFILNICVPEVPQLRILSGKSPEGVTVAASLTPSLDASTAPRRPIDIVVDCSGSMSGISIRQAAQAVDNIVSKLSPEDTFNLVRFGSDYTHLFNAHQAATPENLAVAKRFARNLQADMGGTETGKALQFVYSVAKKEEKPSDILLITDGDIWFKDNLFAEAKSSSCRIFPVGVGMAPAEGVLSKLAKETGGKVEYVNVGEEMGRKIVRHFERIGTPAYKAQAQWPGNPLWVWPRKPHEVFKGDTAYFFACYASLPDMRDLEIFLESKQGNQKREGKIPAMPQEECPLCGSALARMAASRRLEEVRQAQAPVFAERYQLVSKWTNCLVVSEQDAENSDLPELRKVPQMEVCSDACFSSGLGFLGAGVGAMVASCFLSPVFGRRDSSAHMGGDCYDTPAFFRAPREPKRSFETEELALKVAQNLSKPVDARLSLNSIDDFIQLGLSDESAENLSTLASTLNISEAELATILLMFLLRNTDGVFSGKAKKLVQYRFNQLLNGEELYSKLEKEDF